MLSAVRTMLPEALEEPAPVLSVTELIDDLSDDARSKLQLVLGNIDREPDEKKYRTLKTKNRSMSKFLASQPTVEPLLKLAGFEEGDECLVFPDDAPLEQLRSVLRSIDKAEPTPPSQPDAEAQAAASSAEDQLRALLPGVAPDSPQHGVSPQGSAVPALRAARAEDQLRELLRGGAATATGQPATPVARPRIRVDSSPLQRAVVSGSPGGTPVPARVTANASLKRRDPQAELQSPGQPEPEAEPEPESEPEPDPEPAAHRDSEETQPHGLDAAAACVAAKEKAGKDEQQRLLAETAQTAEQAVAQAAAHAAAVKEQERKASEAAEAASAAQAEELEALLSSSSVPTRHAIMLMGGVIECELAQAELGNLRSIISGKLQEAERRHTILQERLRALLPNP